MIIPNGCVRCPDGDAAPRRWLLQPYGYHRLVAEGNATTLEEMVAKGTVDLAFRPLLPKIRENDPLAQQASISIDDILSQPLIGNPAGSEEDGGGFDVRNSLGEAAARANIAYLTRNVALFWLRRRGYSAVVKAFLDAQHKAPLPPGVVGIAAG